MSLDHIPQPRTTREAVLLTLSYFDAQGLPLTAFDTWYNLIRFEASYRDVLAELTALAQPTVSTSFSGAVAGQLTVQDGYYSLRGPDAVEHRQLRHKISEFKWRQARRVARLLSVVPFIEAVAVVDSVALNKAKPESDIDFFIVTQPGRMWTARMLATGLTHLLRVRRHGRAIRNRACLSFYATSDALALEQLSIPGGDLYLAQWVFLVSPLWQRRGQKGQAFDLADELLTRNTWASEIFPQRAYGGYLTDRRRVEPSVARFNQGIRWFGEKLLAGRLEQRLRKIQLKYMHKPAPFELKNRTSHIVINNQMLKFHERDRRTWFRERTVTTYQKLLAGEPLATVPSAAHFAAGLLVQPIEGTAVGEAMQATPQSIVAGIPAT